MQFPMINVIDGNIMEFKTPIISLNYYYSNINIKMGIYENSSFFRVSNFIKSIFRKIRHLK